MFYALHCFQENPTPEMNDLCLLKMSQSVTSASPTRFIMEMFRPIKMSPLAVRNGAACRSLVTLFNLRQSSPILAILVWCFSSKRIFVYNIFLIIISDTVSTKTATKTLVLNMEMAQYD